MLIINVDNELLDCYYRGVLESIVMYLQRNVEETHFMTGMDESTRGMCAGTLRNTGATIPK